MRGRYVPNARRGSSLHGATEPRLSDDSEGLQVLRDGELVQGIDRTLDHKAARSRVANRLQLEAC